MKKLLVMLMVVCLLIVGVVGCAEKTAQAAEPAAADEPAAAEPAAEEPAAEEPAAAVTYKVGINNWAEGNTSLDALAKKNSEQLEKLGVEVLVLNDAGNVENSVQNVQTMIASGCNAILWFGAAGDSAFPSVIKMCEEANVGLFNFEAVPSDPEITAMLKSSPIFIGMVNVNQQAGLKGLMDDAYAKGYRNAILIASTPGSSVMDDRYNTFSTYWAELGGTMMGEVRTEDNAADKTAKAEDIITAYPDAEVVFCCMGDHAIAAYNAIQKRTDCDMAIYTFDIDAGTADYMINGAIDVAAGGQSGTYPYLNAVAIYNWLIEKPFIDASGNGAVFQVDPCIVAGDFATYYKKYWVDGDLFSLEEMQQWCHDVNPEWTYDEMYKVFSEYSIKGILTNKYNNGELTDEEAATLGLK